VPSLNDVVAGSSADSSCIQQVVDALKGTAGKGVPISVTAVNDSGNFALDVRNQETVNGRAFRVRDSSNNTQIQADANGVTINQLVVSSGSITGSTFSGGLIKNSTLSSVSIGQSTMSLLAASSNVVQVPSVRANNTSTPTAANGALTVLNFNRKLWDNDSLHSTAGGASSRFTASRAGLWSLGASVEFEANSSGFRNLTLLVNSSAIAVVQVVNAGVTTILNVAADWQLATSDTVSVAVNQNSGAGLGVSTSVGYGCEFWMTYRGAT